MPMGEDDLTDRLSAKRQYVVVLRLTVEPNGTTSGELLDPLTEQRQRFAGHERLTAAVLAWIDKALGTERNSGQ